MNLQLADAHGVNNIQHFWATVYVYIQACFLSDLTQASNVMSSLKHNVSFTKEDLSDGGMTQIL